MSSVRTFLAGFDFGTTTSACVLASAQVLRNAVNGRMEFSDYRVEYAPDAVFTPLAAAGAIDLGVLESILAAWLGEIRGRAGHDLFGGAIVTGLTARRENAGQISALLRKHVGNVIVATVEDPRLESRLSFAGSAYALSVEHPDRVFVNFDIGGGTTNIAYGRCGEVIDTASLYVGARHAEFRPGTFALVRASEWGQKLGADPDRIVASAIRGLEDLVLNGTLPAEFTQSPFLLPFAPADFVLTFSGGVGELVYDLADNPRPLPRCSATSAASWRRPSSLRRSCGETCASSCPSTGGAPRWSGSPFTTRSYRVRRCLSAARCACRSGSWRSSAGWTRIRARKRFHACWRTRVR